MQKILKFDASASKGSGCRRYLRYISIDGWREPLVSNDVQYGSAVHKFIAVMYETSGDFAAAVKAAQEIMRRPCIVKPKKDHLNEKHLLKTCLDFWEQFLQKDNFELLINPATGKPMVEQTFSLLVYEDEFVQIYIEGTIDKTGKIKNGCYAIGDYKTTSSYDPEKYLRPYRISPQLKMYLWAVKEQGKRAPDSIFAEISKGQMGAFIDGIFLKSAKETTFQRSEVFQFKDWEMKEFEELLKYKIITLAELYKNGNFAIPDGKITGQCTHGSWPCKFLDVCMANDSVTADFVLKKNFIQKPYEPLLFGED